MTVEPNKVNGEDGSSTLHPSVGETDIGLHHSRRAGVRTVSHKDGRPYPGWPKAVP